VLIILRDFSLFRFAQTLNNLLCAVDYKRLNIMLSLLRNWLLSVYRSFCLSLFLIAVFVFRWSLLFYFCYLCLLIVQGFNPLMSSMTNNGSCCCCCRIHRVHHEKGTRAQRCHSHRYQSTPPAPYATRQTVVSKHLRRFLLTRETINNFFAGVTVLGLRKFLSIFVILGTLMWFCFLIIDLDAIVLRDREESICFIVVCSLHSL